jgi:flagellar hook-length control protein FliK
MIDSMLVIAAPVGPSSVFAKSAPATQSRIENGPSGFAEALAQSTELAGATAEAALSPGHLPVSPDLAVETRDETGSELVAGADLTALLAWVAAESLTVPLSVAGKASPDNTGITSGIRTVDDQPAGTTSPAANLHRPAGAPVTPVPVDTFPASIAAEEEPPIPDIDNLQAASGHRPAPRVLPADAGNRDGMRDSPALHQQISPVTAQAKSAEIQSASATQKSDELRPPTVNEVEMVAGANPAAGTAAQAHGLHGPSLSGPTATLLVPAHVDSPAWSRDFGQHVIRLTTQGQPTAEIHLNPPDLGPIRVSIEVQGRDATLQFSAAHPQTREALEAALPRLRDMFAAGSLTLVSASVGSESFPQHASGGHGQRFDQPQAAPMIWHSLAIDDTVSTAIAAPRTPAGGSRIDLFA